MRSLKTRRKMKLQKNIFVICVLGSILLCAKWFKIHLINNFGFKMRSSGLSHGNIKLPYVKYVLLWNKPKKLPLCSMDEDHGMFIKKNCAMKNCYITSDVSFFYNVTTFDAILFHGPEIVFKNPRFILPNERSPNQSYIFVSSESADYYYVPDYRYNRVFNFTWTYKLNSDVYFGYIIIRDHKGNVIGPKANMSWINIDDMLPINDTIKEKLKDKKIAAAWFVSNCTPLNKRQKMAVKIKDELSKYNMSVDIFGSCWQKECPLYLMDRCLAMLQRDYYFYFAFENSMSDDYVTEKLLNALQNYVVPVVFGGADYKRFMPDGIYLNARNMTIPELVNYMVKLIKSEEKYRNFFKWHNHYSYHSPDESTKTDSYCEFCDFLNRVEIGGGFINDFFQWWNPHATIPA